MLLTKNPSLFGRILLAKANTARRLPRLPARKKIGEVTFECDLANYHGTAPIYFGSYALVLIEAMKKILKPGDIFFDVGANIGYLSAVAASLVGSHGQVHSFEPVPQYHGRLSRLAQLNPSHTIVANAFAVGDIPGQANIFVTQEAGQNTMIPSYKSPAEITSVMTVPVVRLDSYIAENGIGRIALIKIDAEGFEFPILKSLSSYFELSSDRPTLICEIAPRAYPLMGWNISDLAAYMARAGYTARDVIDPSKRVDMKSIAHVDDVLFLAA